MPTRQFRLQFTGIAFIGLVLLVGVLVRGSGPSRAGASALAPLPAGWPTTLQLGMSDSPGGAAAMKATTNFGFRYQYLAGGANTGIGWATWNTNGNFVTYYIQDSLANGIVPVFTYYQIRQSAPGSGQGESVGVSGNLQNVSTMSAYFQDLKLFYERAGAFPNLVVLHVEPDMWGYLQQLSSGDNAATVPAAVASTGMPELAGLPNNVSGLARAVARLRDLYAPNVRIGYHLSYWGTGVDPLYSKPSDATIDSLATRSANFYASLGVSFDVSFAEFSDRDAGFHQYVYGNPSAWWAPEDFARNVRYLGKFSTITQTRVVMWQIPLGNTRMRAMNNTWSHYQDNRPEWLLDDPARPRLIEYLNAGVVAFLFGGGAGGTTCACDAAGDGVTNPAPINGNDLASLSVDDDGGYFRSKAKTYYSTAPLDLGGSASPPPPTTPTNTQAPANTQTPTNTPTRTPTATSTPGPLSTPTTSATATRTPTPTAAPVSGWTTSASVSPFSPARRTSVTITALVGVGTSTTALVDVEVYDPAGRRVYQQVYDNTVFQAGVTKTFKAVWRVPRSAPTGTYTVKVGVFSPGWGSMYSWNDRASTFTVR